MKKLESKPVIVLSKCIEHGFCRYDSSQISSSFIKKLEDYVEFITICPEVGIGLSTPREAIRIIRENEEEKLVYSMTGTDVTNEMTDFAQNFVKGLEGKTIHGFILKSRSPSCGVKDVKMYKTIGKAPSIGDKTSGFFGRAILDSFGGLPIEDEGRLTNYNIREHFLTRIFTLTMYDTVIKENTIKSLIDFHSKNKYLLMAYHQMNQKKLGKIVANQEGKNIEIIIEEYLTLLKKSLEKPLRRGTNMNMLMHLLGYFKKELSKEEKAYFLDMLEQYSNKKVPFSVPIAIINAWVIRFNEPYLKSQTIFSAYPSDILEVTDSGKGIK